MTLQEATLIKRMAQHNMAERNPTKQDEKYVPRAVRMLVYVACLDCAMIDMGEELTAAGFMRHAVKHCYNQALRLVEEAHGTAHSMLHEVTETAARDYNDRMDETYQRITDGILVPPPERAYNIVLSLCRLIKELNSSISSRYDFRPATRLYCIQTILNIPALKDYEVDKIIERITK